ncbi:hypothetical protein MBLNU459_g5158t1 [Dothideomycetes sp. NU459]
MSDYNQTARALALPIDDPPPHPRSSTSSASPVFSRRSTSQPRRPSSAASSLLAEAAKLQRRLTKAYLGLSPLQRIVLSAGGLVVLVLAILFFVFNERVFAALEPFAKRWRDTPGAWLVLWAATFLVGFPPLIGYSSCVTVAGFVYGVPKGWLIVASATVLGSTASFIVSRTILRSYVERMTGNDKRFAALSSTLKHDGIKILVMIRLCPLPYSFSNGAVSTIPTVQWPQFMLASAIASPKLLLHVFIGSRLGAIAESGDKMDAKTKAVSYVSILIGMCAGVATGWFMYTKTKARARELEAEEREAAIRGDGLGLADDDDDDDAALAEEGRFHFSDDAMDDDATAAVRDQDGISLHSDAAYRDAFSDEDEGDAQSLDDVFKHGDGDGYDDEQEEDAWRDARR